MTDDAFDVDASAFTAAILAFGPAFTVEAGLVIEEAMRDSGKVVERNVARRLRRHHKTGKLARRLTTIESGAGWDLSVMVASNSPVAHLITGGTRPHEIRVKTAAAIPVRSAGEFVGFREAIQHTGTRADPYFHRGVKDSEDAIERILSDAAGALAAQLASDVRSG